MATQALQKTSVMERSSTPAMDQKSGYADEVRTLRERVAVLEAALAAAEARSAKTVVREAPPLTSIDFAPVAPTPATHVVVESEFTAPQTPAVVAVTEQVAHAQAPIQPATASETNFADAWNNDEATFEERIAAKAFFRVSSVDEESRNWLLDSE